MLHPEALRNSCTDGEFVDRVVEALRAIDGGWGYNALSADTVAYYAGDPGAEPSRAARMWRSSASSPAAAARTRTQPGPGRRSRGCGDTRATGERRTMADGQTEYAADLPLDALIGGETRHITIHTDRLPTAANEVNGNGYARQAVAAAGWTKLTVDGFRRLANTAATAFPRPTGTGWGTAAGSLGCWTAPPGDAGAQLLWHVDRDGAIPAGADVEVAAGEFGYELALAE